MDYTFRLFESDGTRFEKLSVDALSAPTTEPVQSEEILPLLQYSKKYFDFWPKDTYTWERRMDTCQKRRLHCASCAYCTSMNLREFRGVESAVSEQKCAMLDLAERGED